MQPLPIGKMNENEFNKLVLNEGLLSNETIAGLKNLLEEFPYFQLGWLVYLKNLKAVNSPDYNSVLKQVAVRISNRKLLYKYLNSEIPNKIVGQPLKSKLGNRFAYQLENESEIENSDSLIDKFLSSNVGAIRRKITDEQQQEMSEENKIIEKSVEENNEIITETLANIYFQQKKYNKALDSYRKLSLKYPEKSVYFATRIEEIEELKNFN